MSSRVIGRSSTVMASLPGDCRSRGVGSTPTAPPSWRWSVTLMANPPRPAGHLRAPRLRGGRGPRDLTKVYLCSVWRQGKKPATQAHSPRIVRSRNARPRPAGRAAPPNPGRGARIDEYRLVLPVPRPLRAGGALRDRRRLARVEVGPRRPARLVGGRRGRRAGPLRDHPHAPGEPLRAGLRGVRRILHRPVAPLGLGARRRPARPRGRPRRGDRADRGLRDVLRAAPALRRRGDRGRGFTPRRRARRGWRGSGGGPRARPA